ncbi:MAG: CorA family divalent cation transporter [Myxococcaceae bacterium]|nr:CorA family divalent cation transporter [Myxococcaceae bacterium]
MRTPIPNQWNVPARFRARMGDAAGRQRAMVHEGHLLLVLHEVPQAGRPERVARLFWRDAAGQWKASGQGAGVGALREHVTEFERAVDELEEHLRLASRARDWFDVLREATPLQRTAHHLAQTLQAARDAIEDRELITLRDRANDVERAIDLVTAEARDAIDFVTAQKAEAQAAVSLDLARASHSLNVVAAVFLPMTALASIFGMELRSGLEAVSGPWLFWGVVVAGLGLGLVMRRRLSRFEDEPRPTATPKSLPERGVPVRA